MKVNYYSGIVFLRIHSVDTGREPVRNLTRTAGQNGILPGTWNLPYPYLPEQLKMLLLYGSMPSSRRLISSSAPAVVRMPVSDHFLMN